MESLAAAEKRTNETKSKFKPASVAAEGAEDAELFQLVAGIGILATSAGAAGRELFVSPSGDDAHPGTLEEPPATLPMAQRLAREMRKRDGEAITVILLPGTFYLSQALVFGTEDSGSREAPATWQASKERREEGQCRGHVRLADHHYSADENHHQGLEAGGGARKVLIGGASVTRRYAQEIGADGYSESAQGTVVMANQALGTRA